MSSSTGLPTVIIIGAAKCGTTSLHHYLGSHPEISMSRLKETNFFLESGRNSRRGIDWYRAQFDARYPVRGETSTEYTDLPRSSGVATRIRQLLPDVKLIYLVRDPLQRIASQYVHYRAVGQEPLSFREAVSEPESRYVVRSMYATQLRPFLAQFPRDRILIETQERLLTQRLDILRRVFGFVGADPAFESDRFARLWERSEGKGRLYSLGMRIGYKTSDRGLFMPTLLKWPAQRILRSRVTGGGTERPTYDPGLKRLVCEQLRDDVGVLQQLIDFPLDDWDPNFTGRSSAQAARPM